MCNCCCHGDTYSAEMPMASTAAPGDMTTTAMMGSAYNPYICSDGSDTQMCCMSVNSASVLFEDDIEAAIANGDVDGSCLEGQVLAAIVDLGIIVEDLLAVTFDGSSVIVTFQATVDPDTVESIQAALNEAISGGLEFPCANSVALPGSTSFENIVSPDPENKVTLINFCVDTGKSGKASKSGKSSKDDDSMDMDMGGSTTDCVEQPRGGGVNAGKSGKSDKSGKSNKSKKSKKSKKKGKKGSLFARMSTNRYARAAGAAFLGVGILIVGAIGFKKYQSSRRLDEATEHTPLLTEDDVPGFA